MNRSDLGTLSVFSSQPVPLFWHPLFLATAISFLLCCLVTDPVSCAPQESPVAAQEVRESSELDAEKIQYFEKQVKPILQRHCLECHGHDPNSLGGDLSLLSRDLVLRGGGTGPAIDLKQPRESLLLDAIHYRTYEMPPGGKLSEEKIAILTRWVEWGVPWSPDSAVQSLSGEVHPDVPQVNAESKAFWSFQPVKRIQPPEVKDVDWVTNDVDRFILARLEQTGLQPSPTADKRSLMRRSHYDLLGLPPAPDDVEAFVSQPSEATYRHLIDRLLDSPHYGEKWGRHWLDVVRYAESNSFERDGTKPFVWRYRDYVIRAFNADKPYDQFLMEQLAGDELEAPTADSIIATGYYRLGQWDDEPADPQQALYDDLDDILATTSQAMIGLTINCARCHDHKIDPIPTEDYYRMLAFFRNVRRYGVHGHESVLDASSRQLQREDELDSSVIRRYREELANQQAIVREIEELAKADFQPVEHEEFQYEQNRLRLLRKRLDREIISPEQFRKYERARNQLKQLRDNPPDRYRVLCVREHGEVVPATHVLVRGNPGVPGRRVEPGFVSVLSPPRPDIQPLERSHSSGRRLALARWITDRRHPLTARVMANRIWQHHFGRGIVRTSNDFGFQGSPPTHPRLLDYLAAELVDSGWSIKHLHRLIMNSSAYRMSSRLDTRAFQQDPLNDLFWRFEMRRLTAEEVRDSILAVSGRLNRERMYGPSVFAPLSKEVLSGQSMPGNGWGKSSETEQRRRSIYIHVKRSLQVPLLASFDAADTDFSCPVRFNTTQPTQALGLMNSEFIHREARAFAQVVRQQHPSLADQVEDVLRRVTQRPPTADEVARGMRLIEQWQTEDGVDRVQAMAYFCLLAFNLNEFMFVE